MGDDTPAGEAFKKWADTRGVWPRLTHEEIFRAGWDAHQSEITPTAEQYFEAGRVLGEATPAVAAPSAGTSRISTHWDGCGSEGGPRHYECLLREYERLERELADLRSAFKKRIKAEDAIKARLEKELEAAQSATQPTAGVELLREWQALYREMLATFIPQARTTQGGLAARTDEFLAAVGGKSDDEQA